MYLISTFDYGRGNLCVACHKTRTMSPEPDPNSSDPIEITGSGRWYPHYGVQGQMLAGTGGFEFAGETYSNSYHTNATLFLNKVAKSVIWLNQMQEVDKVVVIQ